MGVVGMLDPPEDELELVQHLAQLFIHWRDCAIIQYLVNFRIPGHLMTTSVEQYLESHMPCMSICFWVFFPVYAIHWIFTKT